MGLYARVVLPRLIDLSMRSPQLAPYRARVLSNARGRVLEIGIGSGCNAAYYPDSVETVTGIDPSLELLNIARSRIGAVRFPLGLARSSAEALPFAPANFDCVATTLTLCSIPDVALALREMRRVLKPQGTLVFLEHGLSPDQGIGAWQNRLTPLWRRVAGGCHLDRKIDRLIEAAGFRIADMSTGYARGPRPMVYFYEGVARPA